MNGKYLVNFKAPIGGVEASLSVGGDTAQEVVDSALELLDILRDGMELERQARIQAEVNAAAEPKSNGPKLMPAPKPAPAPTTNGTDPTCPDHNKSKPSDFGGLYCPTRLEDGTYCQWKVKPAKK